MSQTPDELEFGQDEPFELTEEEQASFSEENYLKGECIDTLLALLDTDPVQLCPTNEEARVGFTAVQIQAVQTLMQIVVTDVRADLETEKMALWKQAMALKEQEQGGAGLGIVGAN